MSIRLTTLRNLKIFYQVDGDDDSAVFLVLVCDCAWFLEASPFNGERLAQLESPDEFWEDFEKVILENIHFIV